MASDDTNKKQNNSSNANDKRSQNNGQGFAAMPDDRVEEIARQGGQAAQASGNAHQLTDEDRRKGGEARADDPDVKSGELGRMGAQARWGDDSSSSSRVKKSDDR